MKLKIRNQERNSMKRKVGSLKRLIKWEASCQANWEKKRETGHKLLLSEIKEGLSLQFPWKIKLILKECYEQLYVHTFDNVGKVDQFAETHHGPKFTQEEIKFQFCKMKKVLEICTTMWIYFTFLKCTPKNVKKVSFIMFLLS